MSRCRSRRTDSNRRGSAQRDSICHKVCTVDARSRRSFCTQNQHLLSVFEKKVLVSTYLVDRCAVTQRKLGQHWRQRRRRRPNAVCALRTFVDDRHVEDAFDGDIDRFLLVVVAVLDQVVQRMTMVVDVQYCYSVDAADVEIAT